MSSCIAISADIIGRIAIIGIISNYPDRFILGLYVSFTFLNKPISKDIPIV